MQRISRLRRLAREEEGFSLVFVGLGFLAFLGVSMLAIDVGMLMTARSQAQNSADAGALAGATALGFNDWADRSPTGPAVKNAVSASLTNQVMAANVYVTPAEVVFLKDPAGRDNRVQVTVYRDAAHVNPATASPGAMPTLIARYFNVATVGVMATATAEASPADAMTCVKPFTIPDRWNEVTKPPFDPNDSDFNAIDKKGNAINPPDVYINPDGIDPATGAQMGVNNYTGYNALRDAGLEIILKANNGTKIAPSFYYPYAIPGSTGADDYRDAISGCNTTVMRFGDTYDPEPGNMVGPTQQGMDDLIAKDPGARWDDVNKKVISDKKPSPRVVAIPLFDPYYYATGIQQGRNASLKFVNYLGFFIEEMSGSEVKGRITPIGGLRTGIGPAPEAAFPVSIRLVK